MLRREAAGSAAAAAAAVLLLLASCLLQSAAALSHERLLTRQKRIIGPANEIDLDRKIEHFPFAVSLHGHVTKFQFEKGLFGIPVPAMKRYSTNCGATIINHRHVITAAHCVTDKNDKIIADRTWRVYMSGVKRKPNLWERMQNSMYKFWSKIDAGSKMPDGLHAAHAHVEKVFVHPEYDRANHLHDIAVLRVSRMDLSRAGIGSIGLPASASEPASGAVCEYAGWGCVRPQGGIQWRILSVNFTVVSHTVCGDTYSARDPTHWEKVLCARGHQATLCEGDSGGGLICSDSNNRSRRYLAGVASTSASGVPRPELYPSTFVPVGKYLPWLRTFQ